jgi:thiol-disulfide isomerase/thioredoxin
MSTVPVLLVALATSATPGFRGQVLDFSSKNCGPCQQVAPIVARLEREGLPVHSVDVNQYADFAQQYRIDRLPTFVLIVDGKEQQRHIGMLTEQQLREWVKQIPRETARGASPEAGSDGPFVADPHVQLGLPSSTAPAFPEQGDSVGTPERRVAEPNVPAPGPNPLAGGATVRGNNALLDGLERTSTPSGFVDPMQASTRLHVTTGAHTDHGSGTIIECSQGVARILTCGHIFRGFTDGSRIEVDVFTSAGPVTFAGELLKFDLASDVGLVAIACDSALPVVPVATVSQGVEVQDAVVSIGCSGGELPTRQQLAVTALNPFTGPATTECTGVPVVGRSGGGLFRDSGELVGICIASDEPNQRGIYAGLEAVHELLDEAGLAYLYEPVRTASGETPSALAHSAPFPGGAASAEPGSLLGAVAESDMLAEGGSGSAHPFEDRGFATSSEAPSGGNLGPRSVSIASDLEGAEIVCIIRPRNQPESASRVVVIHRATPKLLSYLEGNLAGDITPAARGTAHTLRHSTDETAATPTVSDTSLAGVPRSRMLAAARQPGLQPTTLTQPAIARRYVRTDR